jgi:hypothetical protein
MVSNDLKESACCKRPRVEGWKLSHRSVHIQSPTSYLAAGVTVLTEGVSPLAEPETLPAPKPACSVRPTPLGRLDQGAYSLSPTTSAQS